jgi:hypothetical protein
MCDPCQYWRSSLCIKRSKNVMVVIQTSCKGFEAFSDGFSDPCIIHYEVTLPVGAWIDISWVPEPQIPDDFTYEPENALMRATAINEAEDTAMSLFSHAEFSEIPGCQAVFAPPKQMGNSVAVSPGTTCRISDIGLLITL